MKTVWIDVTYFIRWRRPPVGIIRVEQELIKWAINNLPNIQFFSYAQGEKKFTVISKEVIFTQTASGKSSNRSDLRKVSWIVRPTLKEFKIFLKEVVHASYKFFLSFINVSYHSRVSRFFKKRITSIRACQKKTKVEKTDHCLIDETEIQNSVTHPFEKDDIILCAGMTWNYSGINKELALLKSTHNLLYFAFCYDIIPVKLPHLCVVQCGTFISYFMGLAKSADHVFCISRSTENDFQEFARDMGISCPKTSVVRLGSEIYQGEPCFSSEIQSLIQTKYVLLVSTIERRKNHVCIYKSILYLLENGYKNLPKFVFVGMRGWGINDLLKDIDLDPRVKDYIQILSEISDADLSALYKHALFTVYPSFYEGWGLPVAESLNYGKMAIVSSTSSLPEVGGDLVDYVHPYDIIGWANRIAFYLNNSDELANKEKRIREQYKKDSWEDFSVQVFNKIRLMGDYHDSKR